MNTCRKLEPNSAGSGRRSPMLGTRLMLLALVLTGCRTFNYTEADMRKERLWISGCPNKPCQNSCWHQGHRHDREFLLGWDITGAEGRR